MSWSTDCWVAIAGAAGGIARFVVDAMVRFRFGRSFPFGTLVINVSGSLALGCFSGLVLFHHDPDAWTLIAGTGFCGAFTTFSTASFETVRLLQERKYRLALFNGVGTLVLCVASGALGLVASSA